MICRNPRLCRGVLSAAANVCWPLGGWWLGGLRRLGDSTQRTDDLAIVLPGIEGRSPLNWSIAHGLDDGGFAGTIRVHDWTTGFWPLFPYHLRARRRNRAMASKIADEILAWQDAHPNSNTYIVGHSGGAALVAWVLEAMPEGESVTAAAMLGPALPRDYPLGTALVHVRDRLWNFWTPLDVIFLAAGTLLCGNLDGSHAISAGCFGFRHPTAISSDNRKLYQRKLRQHRFAARHLRHFHVGGHMSWANRTFVAEVVTPRLLAEELKTPSARIRLAPESPAASKIAGFPPF